MYLCLCNALTDRHVREAAAAGHRTVKAVLRHHGVRPQCGKCLSYIRQTLAEHGEGTAERVPAA
ncbi:MAG TPA: (2Fe-2S)-binding protein [Alphaproteobacteria bacterium]|jgi:bacterioferritin-associated ferredoxin|nr:(2Fe-2S)-binding protein [Alphaproteobacteria bacterium]